MEHEVTLTEANFAKEIEQFDGVALVDFWASWCPPCRAMGPVIEKIAVENASNLNVKVCKLDVDANESLSQRFGARSIPTFLVFKGGELREQAYMPLSTTLLPEPSSASRMKGPPRAARHPPPAPVA